MKRFLSILFALALALVPALPALAVDGAPVDYIPSAQYEIVEAHSDDLDDGIHLEIRPSDPEKVNEETLRETAAESDTVQEAGEVSGFEVVDIVMVRDSDGEIIPWDQPIRVAMTYDKLSRLVAIFVQNEDESWTELGFTVGPDYVEMRLPNLSTVAFTFTALEPMPPQEIDIGEEDTPLGPAPGNGSPQTGDRSPLWLGLTLVFALGAALSFRQAGKKASD